MERWQPAGGQLLRNPELRTSGDGRLLGWSVVGPPDHVRVAGGVLALTAETPGLVGVDQRIPLPPGRRTFRVEATIATERVEPAANAERWHRALVGLVGQHADGGRSLARPSHLARLSGTHRPRAYVADVQLADGAVAALLRVRLARVTGAMQVSGLRVVPVTPDRAFRAAATGLLAIWSLVAGAAALRLIRGSPRPFAAIGLVATIGAGLALVLLPDEVSAPFYGLLHAPFRGQVALETVDLAVHLAGFALTALLWRLARPEQAFRRYLALLVLAAVGTELAQGFAAGLADDDLWDVAANLSGVALGAVLAARLPSPRASPGDAGGA
jgi:hypothetical protein